MKDTHEGIKAVTLVALNLAQGANNATLGGVSNMIGTKAAGIDRIIVYPAEKRASI